MTPKGNNDRNSQTVELHNLVLESTKSFGIGYQGARAQYSPNRDSTNRLFGAKRETNIRVHGDSGEDVPGSYSNHSNADSIPNTGFLGLSLLVDLFFCFSRLQATECSQVLHKFVLALRRLHPMVKHCLQVSCRIFYACFVYWRTGLWPRSSKEEPALLMQDIGQAAINFIFLVFVLMVVGKVAGCVVIVANFIVWLSKPFTWLFGRLVFDYL